MRIAVGFLLLLVVVCGYRYIHGKIKERREADRAFLKEEVPFQFQLQPQAVTFPNVEQIVQQICSTQFQSASVCRLSVSPSFNNNTTNHDNVVWTVEAVVKNRVERKPNTTAPLRLDWTSVPTRAGAAVQTGGGGSLSLARSQHNIELTGVSDSFFQNRFGWEAQGLANGRRFRIKVMSLLDYKGEASSALLHGSPITELLLDQDQVWLLGASGANRATGNSLNTETVKSIAAWATTHVNAGPPVANKDGVYCLLLGTINGYCNLPGNSLPITGYRFRGKILAGDYKFGTHHDESIYLRGEAEAHADENIYLIEGYASSREPGSGIYWRALDNKQDIVTVVRVRLYQEKQSKEAKE
jgi:hypothetical protein